MISRNYHQAVLEYLNVEARISPSRLQELRDIETRLGIYLPASIMEWFALEEAESLFSDNTTPDYLVAISELGNPEWFPQGFLPIADENQGVVSWYAKHTESDDPPIYDNHDTDDTSQWRLCSLRFSQFIYHMITIGRIDQGIDNLRLIAQDVPPDAAWLQQILRTATAGSNTVTTTTARYQFFNQHGRMSIRCTRESESTPWNAQWAFESPTPADLLALLHQILPHGTLATTLQERSTNAALRALETTILSQIR